MHIKFSPEDERFRQEAANWLEAQLSGPFRHLRGSRSHTGQSEERRVWEKALGEARWSCIGMPEAYGGRDATLNQQVIFAEEYARAGAPARLGHIGVELTAPTILHFGTDAQKRSFLPRIASGQDIWCQGYSEPGAGSDLANVRTRARLEQGPNGPHWVIEGHKIWTSLAQFSNWIFVICRTEPDTKGAKGLSCLLVPMDQPGVTIRPIKQMTGDAEFNEVFFDGAVTAADNIVGKPGEGWAVAMGTLAFERGASTLAQQMDFRNELNDVIAAAKRNGKAQDPIFRQRLAKAEIGLRIMRYSSLRMLSGDAGSLSNAAYTYKIYWANWRQQLGELAMDILGPAAELAHEDGHFDPLVHMFLMSRSDTIYAGTDQIQRNIIAERALGLPKEARGAA